MPTPVPIPRTIAEVFDHVIATDPDRELLVTRSGRCRYAELDRLANRAAHALASLGVRAGDRVGGSLPNDSDVVIAFHGAMRIGAVWVGINRALAPPEKQYLLDRQRDVAAVVRRADRRATPRCRRRPGCRDRSGRGRASVDGRDGGGGRRPDRRRRRPARAGGHRVHERHDRLPQGRGAQPVQPADAGRGARAPAAATARSLRKGDFLPLTILNMQVLTTLLTAQAGGCSVIFDRIDAARRRRVDPRRAGDHVERAACAHPLAGQRWTTIAPSDLASLTEVWSRRRRLSRADPHRVRGQVRDAGAHDVRVERGADGRHHRRSRRQAHHRAGAVGRCRTSTIQIVDDEICIAPMTSGPWAGVYRPMLGYWERDEATAETLARRGAAHRRPRVRRRRRLSCTSAIARAW